MYYVNYVCQIFLIRKNLKFIKNIDKQKQLINVLNKF